MPGHVRRLDHECVHAVGQRFSLYHPEHSDCLRTGAVLLHLFVLPFHYLTPPDRDPARGPQHLAGGHGRAPCRERGRPDHEHLVAGADPRVRVEDPRGKDVALRHEVVNLDAIAVAEEGPALERRAEQSGSRVDTEDGVPAAEVLDVRVPPAAPEPRGRSDSQSNW